jgi:hypothetical protein
MLTLASHHITRSCARWTLAGLLGFGVGVNLKRWRALSRVWIARVRTVFWWV